MRKVALDGRSLFGQGNGTRCLRGRGQNVPDWSGAVLSHRQRDTSLAGRGVHWFRSCRYHEIVSSLPIAEPSSR
jgi:hypothetical protein